jgi:hypothetical protein
MKRLSIGVLVAAMVAACAGHPEQAGPAAGQPVAVAAPAAGAPAATTNGAATKQVPVTLANATEVQHAG